jgi:DNA-binding IclR family transcriptional regulator
MGKSVIRTCHILKLLAENKEGLKHLQIARALQVPSSSLSGILPDLLQQQFLSFDPSTNRYALGPEILALAGSYLKGLDIVSISRPYIRNLVRDTGESVSLSIRNRRHIVIVHAEESYHMLNATLEVGTRPAMHASASGKAILAYLPDHEIEEYLSSSELTAFTPHTVTDPESLSEELRKIRSSGIAYNREELAHQIIAMAAPIFNLYGEVTASLAVSCFVMRFTAEKEKVIKNALKEAVWAISIKMGFKGGLKQLTA